VAHNSITALIGPNGAGKTTVFNMITGLIHHDAGSVVYKGRSLLGRRPHQIANLGITRTFQLIRLFPKLTVLENLLLAEKKSGESLLNTLFRPGQVKRESHKKARQCMAHLKLVGMESKAHVNAEDLSYGQQKLVEIARVLATGADLILLDEPVAGVNPTMKEHIKKVLFRLKKEGKTILIIEHDMHFVRDVCEKVIVLDAGADIAVGAPSVVMNDKKVLEAYLGNGD
jgi:ABC-type branched-subunit amino acid transport system ATPase component